MENIEIGKVYRHFKGNYYFVENIGYSSENKEPLVIYKALYENPTIWIRPLSEFLAKIDTTRPDNITQQSYRFELVKEISKNHLH